MLSSLPKFFESLKYVTLYDKEGIINLDEAQTALKSKEFSKVKDFKVDDGCEGLCVSRRGSGHGGMFKSRRIDNSRLKCFIC